MTTLQTKEASVPGIGIAGLVMCPHGFQKGACIKQGCELWVELKYGEHMVGRCSAAWTPILLTEIRAAIAALSAPKQEGGERNAT